MKRVICLVLVLTASLAGADEPYFQAFGIRGRAVMREVPTSENPMGLSEHDYWGAEIFGRVPINTKWALIFRTGTEGASGKFAWQDFRTWTRGVAEAAVTFRVLNVERYSCAVQVGGGFSIDLTRAPEHEGLGAPPKYGLGVHCRDEETGIWVNGRALLDRAQGPGVGGELEIHVPLGTEHVAFGAVVVFAEAMRMEFKVKAKLPFEWKPKPKEDGA